jgi:hypothetical protein
MCFQKSVNGIELEKQISEYIGRIQISKKFKDWAIKYLHELHALESITQDAIMEAQQRAYRVCVQAIDNLVDLQTSPENADGSQLSKEEYGHRRGKLLKEKAALEELLRDAGQRVEQQLRLSEKVFEFACTAQERFAKGDAETKKRMLATLGSNLTLKDKKLCIEAKEPFFILEKSKSDEYPGIEAIEPENIGLPYTPNEACVSLYPNVLGDLDDVSNQREIIERAATEVYHFFQSVCLKPESGVTDWWLLYHYEI